MGANEDGPNGANHAPHQTVGISIAPLALFTVIQNHQWEPLLPFALLALLPPFASSLVVIITSSTIVAIGIILAIGTICTISFHWVFWQTHCYWMASSEPFKWRHWWPMAMGCTIGTNGCIAISANGLPLAGIQIVSFESYVSSYFDP